MMRDARRAANGQRGLKMPDPGRLYSSTTPGSVGSRAKCKTCAMWWQALGFLTFQRPATQNSASSYIRLKTPRPAMPTHRQRHESIARTAPSALAQSRYRAVPAIPNLPSPAGEGWAPDRPTETSSAPQQQREDQKRVHDAGPKSGRISQGDARDRDAGHGDEQARQRKLKSTRRPRHFAQIAVLARLERYYFPPRSYPRTSSFSSATTADCWGAPARFTISPGSACMSKSCSPFWPPFHVV